MEIIKKLNNEELLITLKGELNTTTAPELEKVIDTDLKGVTTLIFEFADLRYLSSAGLRVLLVAQKIMNKQGKMIVRHPNEDVMDVFDITGFINVLTMFKIVLEISNDSLQQIYSPTTFDTSSCVGNQ